MSIFDKLSDYQTLEKEIHDYFGYKEDWVVIPLDNQSDMYWFLTGDKERRGSVVYSHKPLTFDVVKEYTQVLNSINENPWGEHKKTDIELYESTIYTQRFLPKWVYREKDATMICVDTHTDGNKFLMIFDNDKEVTDENIISEWRSVYSG